MKFTGGTLSLLLSATVVAASVFQNAPGLSSQSGLTQRSGLFGVTSSSNTGIANTLVVPRGGADSDSEEADDDTPEVLYLPGLLDANVSTKNVRI